MDQEELSQVDDLESPAPEAPTAEEAAPSNDADSSRQEQLSGDEEVTEEQQAEFEEAQQLSQQAEGSEEPPPIQQSTVPADTTAVPEAPAAPPAPAPEGTQEGAEPEATGSEETVEAEDTVEEPEPVTPEAPAEPPVQDVPIPVMDPTSWQNSDIEPVVPPSTDTTESCLQAADQTAENEPQVSPENAGQVGFWSNLGTSIGDGMLGPMMPGYFGRRGDDLKGIADAWNKPASGGWDSARNKVDAVYRTIDLITKVTGPLATILGVVSYIRYLVFLPACVAIGNFLKTISTFLNAVNHILDLVKLVLGVVKIVLGAAALVQNWSDPEKRREMAQTLLGDTLEFGANGFAFGFSQYVGARLNGQKTVDWKKAFSPRASWSAVTDATSGISDSTRSMKAVWQDGGFRRVSSQLEGTLLLTTITKDASSIGRDAIVSDWTGRGIGIAGKGTEKLIEEGARDRRADASEGEAIRYWDFSGSDEVLGTAPSASGASTGDVISQACAASTAAIQTQLETSPRPMTDNPPPPPTVARAPAQRPAIAEERKMVQEQLTALKDQKVTAISGQEEAKALQMAADEHEKKSQDASANLGEAKGQTDGDKGEVETAQSKLAEGKQKTQEGNQAMNKAQDTPGGEPGNSSTDVPWYKKPVVWMIRKVNSAKQKVMGRITKVVTNAVAGAAGIDDIDGVLAEGDELTKKQQQVLGEEPAQLDQMGQVAQKEAADAQQGRGQAQQIEAENKAIEAEADTRIAELEAQDQKLAAEDEAIVAEEANYKAQYGPAIAELDELSEQQKKGEIAPMELSLEEVLGMLLEAIALLMSRMDEHTGELEALGAEHRDAIIAEITGQEGLPEEAEGEGVAAAEETEAEMVGRAEEADGERRQAVEALAGELEALGGQHLTNEILELLSELMGRVEGHGQAFDEERELELQEMHEAFAVTYEGLTEADAA